MAEHFQNSSGVSPNMIDQLRAFDLAIRVLTMARCSSTTSPLVHWKHSLKPVVWRPSDSALNFMSSAVAHEGSPLILNDERLRFRDMAADCLENVHGLKLVGTDDIRMHLFLDGTESVLFVYHYASFLKEYLKMTRSNDSSVP